MRRRHICNPIEKAVSPEFEGERWTGAIYTGGGMINRRIKMKRSQFITATALAAVALSPRQAKAETIRVAPNLWKTNVPGALPIWTCYLGSGYHNGRPIHGASVQAAGPPASWPIHVFPPLMAGPPNQNCILAHENYEIAMLNLAAASLAIIAAVGAELAGATITAGMSLFFLAAGALGLYSAWVACDAQAAQDYFQMQQACGR